MKLTPQQIQFFDEQGYLSDLDLHDESEAGQARRDFDELEAREGKENCEIGLQGRHIDVRFVWELASWLDASILSAVRQTGPCQLDRKTLAGRARARPGPLPELRKLGIAIRLIAQVSSFFDAKTPRSAKNREEIP